MATTELDWRPHRSALPTRTYGVSVRVPLFDGGRRDARRAERPVSLRQESIRTKDLEAQIELDVRLALDGIYLADGQVKTAAGRRGWPRTNWSRRGGVTRPASPPISSRPTRQARLARARENRIAALVSYNLAQIDLYSSLGTGPEGPVGRESPKWSRMRKKIIPVFLIARPSGWAHGGGSGAIRGVPTDRIRLSGNIELTRDRRRLQNAGKIIEPA